MRHYPIINKLKPVQFSIQRPKRIPYTRKRKKTRVLYSKKNTKMRRRDRRRDHQRATSSGCPVYALRLVMGIGRGCEVERIFKGMSCPTHHGVLYVWTFFFVPPFSVEVPWVVFTNDSSFKNSPGGWSSVQRWKSWGWHKPSSFYSYSLFFSYPATLFTVTILSWRGTEENFHQLGGWALGNCQDTNLQYWRCKGKKAEPEMIVFFPFFYTFNSFSLGSWGAFLWSSFLDKKNPFLLRLLRPNIDKIPKGRQSTDYPALSNTLLHLKKRYLLDNSIDPLTKEFQGINFIG